MGHARLGRRDAGAHLQPEDEEGHRHQRARRRADRRDGRVLQVAGLQLSARVRSARRGDARHARRTDDDAGGVRDAVARAGARAGDRRWPTATRSKRRPRTRSSARRPRSRSGSTRRPCSCRTSARRARRRRPARSSVSPISPRRCASCRGREDGARGRQVARRRDPRRVRPLLQRRHRAGDRPRHARGGRPLHDGGSRELEGEDRRAAVDDLQGRRGLQARAVAAGTGAAAGAQHPRDDRREGDGLQQPEVPAHALSDDEPRVRRSRLLLRRSGVSARGADEAGCCRRSTRRRARRRSSPISNDADGRSPAIRIRSRAARIRSSNYLDAWPPAPKPVRTLRRRRTADTRRWEEGFYAGTTSIQAADADGLGDLGDAERRLDSGGDRRADRASASASARSRS